MTAGDLIALLCDDGTFEPWDADVVSADPLEFTDTAGYGQRLEQAAAHAGTNEAVVTGRARVGGHDLVMIAGEFGFLAGTMGLAAGERIVRGFERAADLDLPVLGMPVSGGTRMQEGTPAFLQMIKVSAAVRDFRDRGGRYVVYLRHPTTGGVLATWGSLGQVTFAEPGALIGLTGPRVVELVAAEPVAPGVQTAENLAAHGIIDEVVDPEDLAPRLVRVLEVVDSPRAVPSALTLRPGIREVSSDAWASIMRSREPSRPGIRQLIARVARQVTYLRGDGAGRDDPGCVLALARLEGMAAVVIGHDRPPGERGAALGAVGYRKAVRGMTLARELGLPVVTVIDTRGVSTSREAEEGGLSAEIASCLATLSSLDVPVLAVLLGEGSGAGAIALLPADRVICAEHAWLGPIAPEGVSAILYRDTDHAPQLAQDQGMYSAALLRNGVVDVVVSERGSDPIGDVASVVITELRRLVLQGPDERRRARAARHRALGRGGYLGG